MAYADEVLADSPASYWRLDETAGVAVDDAAANDGTYVNGTRGEPGLVDDGGSNRCVKLDGAGDYVSVAHHATLNFGDVFTVECWFRRDGGNGASQENLMSKCVTSAGSTGWFLQFDNATDRLRCGESYFGFIAHSGDRIIPKGDVETHHAVWTKNGATNVLYLDGVDVTAGVTNFTIENTAGPLNIGATPEGGEGTNSLKGWIDDPAVYPTVLTSTRVGVHYEFGKRKLRPTFAMVPMAVYG